MTTAGPAAPAAPETSFSGFVDNDGGSSDGVSGSVDDDGEWGYEYE